MRGRGGGARFGTGGNHLVFVAAIRGSIVGVVLRKSGFGCGMTEKQVSCLWRGEDEKRGKVVLEFFERGQLLKP